MIINLSQGLGRTWTWNTREWNITGLYGGLQGCLNMAYHTHYLNLWCAFFRKDTTGPEPEPESDRKRQRGEDRITERERQRERESVYERERDRVRDRGRERERGQSQEVLLVQEMQSGNKCPARGPGDPKEIRGSICRSVNHADGFHGLFLCHRLLLLIFFISLLCLGAPVL